MFQSDTLKPVSKTGKQELQLNIPKTVQRSTIIAEFSPNQHGSDLVLSSIGPVEPLDHKVAGALGSRHAEYHCVDGTPAILAGRAARPLLSLLANEYKGGGGTIVAVQHRDRRDVVMRILHLDCVNVAVDVHMVGVDVKMIRSAVHSKLHKLNDH